MNSKAPPNMELKQKTGCKVILRYNERPQLLLMSVKRSFGIPEYHHHHPQIPSSNISLGLTTCKLH